MSSGQVVLIVSDDAATRAALSRALEGGGRTVLEAAGPGETEAALGRASVDAVILAPGSPSSAQNLLHLLQERAAELPVVAVGSPAAELLRHGAHDVVEPGAEPIVLARAVERACERRVLRQEVERLRLETAPLHNRVPLLGRSEAMHEMSRQVDELATRNVSVLLTGVTGTGKNVVAREMHARSHRADQPYVVVSCRGVSETLLESQLFGHRRGAFAGAAQDHAGGLQAARGGTLVLDRIEDMPLPLQGRLAAALRAGQFTPMGAGQALDVDVRIIAMANRSLATMLRSGTFREDLHQKIAEVTLELPPLRDRPEDVPLLAEAFIAEASERFGVAPRRLDAAAQSAILSFRWPGNVRELREAVESAFARGTGDAVRFEHLPASVRAGSRTELERDPERRPTLAESEAELVALVLEEAGGNKTEAARRLGIDRKRLYRKIKRYSLLGPDSGDEGDD